VQRVDVREALGIGHHRALGLLSLIEWAAAEFWWANARGPFPSEFRYLYLESQVGRDITGFYRHPNGGESPFTGTISGENIIDIVIRGGGIRMTGPVVSLLATYNRDSIFGTRMELTFKGGSADGMTLTSVPYTPF
jgi:hypothetical protein